VSLLGEECVCSARERERQLIFGVRCRRRRRG
jgi:hypothetical protein